MLREHLKKLNEIVDPDHVAESRERMLKSCAFEPVDRLPKSVYCAVPGWPTFPYRDGFYDKEKMLLNELAGTWFAAHVRDDRIYTVRANYGVGTVASMFGCESRLTDENTMPWVTHLTDAELDAVLDAGPVDIEGGLGARVFETERFYLDVLSGYDNLSRGVRVFVCDTQGPFDIAHLIMGHRIYTEIYDNPERVHRLLELTTDAYIRFTKAQKEIIGEGLDIGYHNHGGLASRGTVRLCDDAGINISRSSYAEFSKPYNARAFAELNGGWVHYCGNGSQIRPEVLSTEGITGINFGNPEMQDLATIYAEAAPVKAAVLGWGGSAPIPEHITTGITISTHAPDLEAARARAAARQ